MLAAVSFASVVREPSVSEYPQVLDANPSAFGRQISSEIKKH